MPPRPDPPSTRADADADTAVIRRAGADRAALPRAGAARVRGRLYGLLDWLKHAGVSLDPLERALDYWRDVGLLRAAAIVILVTTPLVKYVWLPWMASRLTTTVADIYGVDLEVADWSGTLWDLQATGSDVSVKARGRHARPQLFTSDAVTVDLSLWRWIGGYGWIKNVTLTEPTVYLERTLAGRWNWEDLADVRAGALAVHVATLRLDDLRVEWIEHVPADSGGGLVQSATATLHVDQADVLVQDVILPRDGRRTPSRFSLNGRTADGVVSLTGTGNFFSALDAAATPAPQQASAGGRAVELRARVYLENVGARAIGQMLSRAALVPTSGLMTGHIELLLAAGTLTCRTDLQLRNVAYTANLAATHVRGRADVINAGLIPFRSNTHVQVGCEPIGRETARPLTALQAAVTRAAVADAPPIVRQVALIDERQASGQATEDEMTRLVSDLARTAGQTLAGELGGEVGAAVVKSVDGRSDPGNPVGRGVKGLGRGVKRLFTRDKD